MPPLLHDHCFSQTQTRMHELAFLRAEAHGSNTSIHISEQLAAAANSGYAPSSDADALGVKKNARAPSSARLCIAAATVLCVNADHELQRGNGGRGVAGNPSWHSTLCMRAAALHSRRGRAFPVSHGDATYTDARKGSPTTNTMLCTLSFHCPSSPFGQSKLFLSSASVLVSSIYVRLSASLGAHKETISDLAACLV